MGRLEGAGRRRVDVDFRVALVSEKEKVEAARKRDGAGKVGCARDGALRVRRRAEVESDRALEQRLVGGIQVGKEVSLGRAGKEDWLGA